MVSISRFPFRGWVTTIAIGAASVIAASSASAADWCQEPPAPELKALHQIDVGDAWFVVYQLREGVYALSEPRQAEGVISYLIVGTRHAVLFDTGLGIARISRVVQRLTTLPVTVLNSHTHFDHVGGNAEFSDVRNEANAYSRASARGEVAPDLAAYAVSTLDPGHVCGDLPPEASAGSFKTRPWRTSGHVRDGERLELGGRELTVLFTPGHTPDSLCLLDAHNGLLFTGDTFYRGSIYLWAPGTDLDAYAHSVERLTALIPHLQLLLPAHGMPLADPSLLRELNAAVVGVRARTLVPVVMDKGRRSFRFAHFSVLLAPE